MLAERFLRCILLALFAVALDAAALRADPPGPRAERSAAPSPAASEAQALRAERMARLRARLNERGGEESRPGVGGPREWMLRRALVERAKQIGDRRSDARTEARRLKRRERLETLQRALGLPSTAQLPAPIRAELLTHARREAALARIELLALQSDGKALAERAARLRAREAARHERALARLATQAGAPPSDAPAAPAAAAEKEVR